MQSLQKLLSDASSLEKEAQKLTQQAIEVRKGLSSILGEKPAREPSEDPQNQRRKKKKIISSKYHEQVRRIIDALKNNSNISNDFQAFEYLSSRYDIATNTLRNILYKRTRPIKSTQEKLDYIEIMESSTQNNA